jgi:hypothetical protein
VTDKLWRIQFYYTTPLYEAVYADDPFRFNQPLCQVTIRAENAEQAWEKLISHPHDANADLASCEYHIRRKWKLGVLDNSCRDRYKKYYISADRWQRVDDFLRGIVDLISGAIS